MCLDTVIRRCCTSDCGPTNSISGYEGRTAYFCSTDLCNRVGSEAVLTGGISMVKMKRERVYRNDLILALSSTMTSITSLTTPTPTMTTTTATGQSSLQCYDCSGMNCGQDGSTVATNCPMCMVYRNPDDQSRNLKKSNIY